MTLAMAISMAVLDGTIVTVALPTMARQFAVAPESAIWIVNAFQLAVTVSLLPLAALGDMFGYRRVYWWGLALFTFASLACALAPTFAVLTFARVVQGLGAAGIMSVNIALIRFIYPHARLGQGVGNIAVVVAVSTAGSPSVAAAILSVASWHWLFLINVPIGVVALVMAAQTLPATPRAAGRLDLWSVLLNALTFGLVIAGVNGIGQGGNLSWALIEIAVGAAIGVALVRRQLKLSAPLLPVDLLRRPVFALSLATSIASFGAQSLGHRLLAVLFRGPAGPLGIDFRTAPDPLAGRDRLDRADRRTPGRSIHPRHPWQHRSFGDGSRAGSRCSWSRRCQSGLAGMAARDLWPRLRFFPVAQQSGDYRQRATRAKRRGGRPAILGSADRPVVRNGAGGGRSRTSARARDGDCAVGRCCAHASRRGHQRLTQGGLRRIRLPGPALATRTHPC